MLSVVFLYLSVDDFVEIHEILIRPMRALLDTGRLFYYAWVVPGMILILILGVYFLRFFMALPARYKKLFGLSALVLIFGAVGMEIVEGFVAPTGEEWPSLLCAIVVMIQESLEMAGVLLFIYSLADYIRAYDIKGYSLENKGAGT